MPTVKPSFNTQTFTYILYFTTSLFISGTFIQHTTALLTIGAYSSLAIALYVLLTNADETKQRLKTSWAEYKWLYVSLTVFFAYLVVTSFFFTYDNLYATSLNEIYRSTRYGFILWIVGFALSRNRYFLSYIFVIFTFIAFTIIFPITYGLFLQGNLNSWTLRTTTGSDSLNYLAPFIFVLLLGNFKPFYKILIALLLALIFAYTLYTANRGGFLSLSIILLIFMSFFVGRTSLSIKKIIIISSIFLLSMASLLIVLNITSPRVNEKLDQSLYDWHNPNKFSSGRVDIVETRFPIINKQVTYWHGIGYGSIAYQKILLDNHAPKVVGRYIINSNEKKVFWYFRNDPQLLIIYYESGLVGLILFLLLLFTVLGHSFSRRNDSNYHTLFGLALFMYAIAVILVRGIFEHFGFSLLLFFIAILVTSKPKKDYSVKSLHQNFKEIQKELNISTNDACYIIASGPSTAELPLEKLKGKHIIAVNGAIKNLLSHNINPNFYCVVDSDFLRKKQSLVIKGINASRLFITSDEGLDKIVEKHWFKTHKDILTTVIKIDNNFQIGQKDIFVEGGSVIAVAIQTAILLGYKTINLIGVDLSFDNKRSYKETKPRRSHLQQNYKPFIEPFFKSVRKYADGNKIQVFNLSENSHLPDNIIPKKKFIDAV